MTINNYDIQIDSLAIHWVGNKNNDDGIIISKGEIELKDEISSVLLKYFISPIKNDELYEFTHNSNIELNEVYNYVSKIFDNPKQLHKQSVLLAKFLYENSEHPNIKAGEFYIAYFSHCDIDNKNTDAVGIFKSENKDTFLEVRSDNTSFSIKSEQGININRLDKGCIIYNLNKENGYVVSIIDNTNKGNDAKYWINNFLHVIPQKDAYYNTQSILSFCKNFAKNELAQHPKVDQADFLNKSIRFFKENDQFSLEKFTSEVIERPEIISSFNNYKTSFQENNDIEILESFTISESAVKKQIRSLKNVIKLDKNFDIHIYGNRNLIEQGIDEKGKYYKVYYIEES
ncbi:MAG: nucleoid-associated protein [Prevotella sp.]|jgi:hypothetical protein|nr:nucleoid-associated protein [Prevotella sp.]